MTSTPAVEDVGSLENILEKLSDNISYYDFFSTLRLLECIEGSRFGQNKTPEKDPLFLGQAPHMAFTGVNATDLAYVRKSENHDSNWLDVFFFGLLGPNGPLPLYLSEQIYKDSSSKKDTNTRDFLNIFHHRLLSLFYRSWANKEPTVQFDIEDKDHFQFYLRSLSGYGLEALRNRDSFSDYSKARFSAYLGGKTRHKDGLQNMIYQLYGMESNIIEFKGEWLPIPSEFHCQLRERYYAKKLGKDTTLGTQSWQSQYKFQVQLGPLTRATYEKSLPNTAMLKQVNETIRNYMGDEFQWEIILLLDKAEMPIVELGIYGQLGWTSWLKSAHEKSMCGFLDNVRFDSNQIQYSQLP